MPGPAALGSGNCSATAAGCASPPARLQPFGNGHLIPRGNLLELPKAALRRADAVVLHHADLAGGRPVGRA